MSENKVVYALNSLINILHTLLGGIYQGGTIADLRKSHCRFAAYYPEWFGRSASLSVRLAYMVSMFP